MIFFKIFGKIQFKKPNLAITGTGKNIFLLCLVLVLTHCAPWASKPDSLNDENAFRPVALAITNQPAVPAEIANDIKLINEGKKLPESSDWTTLPPEGLAATPPPAEPEPSKLDDLPPEPPLKAEIKIPSQREVAGVKCKKNKQNCTEEYTVKVGDTLMKISFAKYGNLYRWREIYEKNKSKISSFNILQIGMTLTIEGVEYLVIEKNGEPYLIRKGDTLVKISDKVYGKPELWKSIWKNNPSLIKNPNKIYAGFTLYYKPQKGKKLD